LVERARLTPRIVSESACPTTGERWISDTKVRGFGLRLWATKSGGQKAFAIRVSDSSSKKVRRTFHPRNISGAHLREGNGKDVLSDHLDEAREWAQDEIDRIKQRPTRHEEDSVQHRITGRLTRAMTLHRAAEALLRGMLSNGSSEAYRDRLGKLYALHIPQRLKQIPLERLEPWQVASALVKSKASTGNVRILRSFISQIIERAATFSGSLRRFHDEFSREFSIQWDRNRDVRYPELRKISAKKYKALFRALEADDTYWQQAMAIRMYFTFHAPLSRILRAQWKQIHENYWYPYHPGEKKYWFECREGIDGDAQELLRRIKRLGEQDFATSPFWFPSRHPRNVHHIRTIDLAWRRALRKSRLDYYPLREFSRSFREFNNPSYYLSFLRQHGQTGREIQNMAAVSKALTRRTKIQ